MTVYFRLEALEVGLMPGRRKLRGRADYLRMVRGWAFDPNSQEGAVLKTWNLESRFRPAGAFTMGDYWTIASGTILTCTSEQACSRGLCNTNALEAQQTYCTPIPSTNSGVSNRRRRIGNLYRGFNRFSDDQVLAKADRRRWVMLLNNLQFLQRPPRACRVR